MREQGAHLVFGEYHRHVLRPLRAHHAVHPRQIGLQHLAVEKQQRGQRLVLRRGRHLSNCGEIGQESFNLRAAYLARMLLGVEKMKRRIQYT